MSSIALPSRPTTLHESTAAESGVVTGRPLVLLRVEGAALLIAALVAFSFTGQAWWLVPAALLLPDLAAVGYLVGRRVGALAYNLAHSTTLPLAAIGAGLWQGQHLVVALALVWLTHIGMDRALNYGLKYDDDARHTHLGWHGNHDARTASGTLVP
jgi:hypothetical protein